MNGSRRLTGRKPSASQARVGPSARLGRAGTEGFSAIGGSTRGADPPDCAAGPAVRDPRPTTSFGRAVKRDWCASGSEPPRPPDRSRRAGVALSRKRFVGTEGLEHPCPPDRHRRAGVSPSRKTLVGRGGVEPPWVAPSRKRHVGTEGFEPPRVSPLAPKASASASFATCPLGILSCSRLRDASASFAIYPRKVLRDASAPAAFQRDHVPDQCASL